MASEKPPLTVIRSPTAIDELDDVWRWNAEHYSVPHADAYLRFLKASIAGVRVTWRKEFPPPHVLRGRVGVGVERGLAHETPTLTLPLRTWGGEEEGLQNVSRTRIADLANSYARGKTVSARPDLHYVVIRRRTRGHGHVAVYNFDDKEVHVLHIFHTAQDWQTKLIREDPRFP